MVDIVVPFGGGVNSRAFAEDIQERECKSGQNFDLDPQNRAFKNRAPYDLVGTTPNTAEVRGFATLLKTDGSVSFLVQAGNTVYDWDGVSTFTSKGTVSATAKLRGRIEHNWQLSDKVIITDVNLQQPVMEYDGTTLANVSFLSNPSTAWTGDFKAKYCTVVDERVIFSNIDDNSTAFPHMIVGTKRSDYTTLSVSDRPADSLAVDDPFFLLQPNLRAINGMAQAFNVVAISSAQGAIWKLTGTSSKDFAMAQLHPGSGASGDEAITFVGNDIVYGRGGRVESLINTDKFGDIDTDDLSFPIFDQIQNYTGWTIVYNSRNQRIYCFPESQSECWVFHKSMVPTGLSPWVKWVTQDSMAFQPTAVMNMYDPVDGLEYVFAGDSSGNVYRIEGSGTGDNASSIISKRTSKLFKVPGLQEMTNVRGYIEYIAKEAVELTVKLLYQGRTILTTEVTSDIPAPTTPVVYGGTYYYGDGSAYGVETGKIKRQEVSFTGGGDMLQIEVTANTTNDFEITEVGLTFQT